MCSQTGQGGGTRFQYELTFPSNSIAGHPRANGSLVGQAHGGHEPLYNSCQVGYHPTKGFEAGVPYQSQQWCGHVFGSHLEGLNIFIVICCHYGIIPGAYPCPVSL